MDTVSTILILAGKIVGIWLIASIVAAPLIGRVLRARSYEGRHRR